MPGPADAFYLAQGVRGLHERADEADILAFIEDGFGDDADEEDPHPRDLDDTKRVEQPLVIGGYAQVRIHDGEVGALFQEEHVSRAVIDLVVAYGRNVGCEHVHDLDGGNALVFGVDERAQEHAARDCVEHRVLFAADLVEVSGKHRDAADQLGIDFVGHKIAVHVVGMEQRELLQAMLARLLSNRIFMLCGKCRPNVAVRHFTIPSRHFG